MIGQFVSLGKPSEIIQEWVMKSYKPAELTKARLEDGSYYAVSNFKDNEDGTLDVNSVNIDNKHFIEME